MFSCTFCTALDKESTKSTRNIKPLCVLMQFACCIEYETALLHAVQNMQFMKIERALLFFGFNPTTDVSGHPI